MTEAVRQLENMTLEEIRALSDAELLRLRNAGRVDTANEPEVSEDEFVSFITGFAEPSAQLPAEAGVGDVLSTAVSNLPFSLAERAREFERVVRNPVETLGTLGSMAAGAGDIASGAFGGDDQTANAQLARQAVEGIKQGFTKEGFARDPLAPVSDVAGLLTGALPVKGAGMLGKIGRGVQMAADPLGTVAKAASDASGLTKFATQLPAQLGREVGAEAIGLTTGKDAQPFREAFRAGNEGGEQSKAFSRGIADESDARTLSEQAQKRIDEIDSSKGKTKGAFVKRNGQKPLMTADIQEMVFGPEGILAQHDITREGQRLVFPRRFRQDRNAVQELADEVRMLGGETTLFELDDALKAVRQIKKPGTEVGSIGTQIEGLMRDRLSEFPGYDQVTGAVRDVKGVQERTAQDLQFRFDTKEGTRNPTSGGRAMQRALSEGREPELGALREAERIIDENSTTPSGLVAEVAGGRLSQLPPSGLIGRGGLVSGGILAGAAFGGLPSWFLSLPAAILFSPKVMGKAAQGLGAARSKIEPLRALAEQMGAAQKTLTIGELIERAENRTDQPSNMLQAIGRGVTPPSL
jgi:hypothetical protein